MKAKIKKLLFLSLIPIIVTPIIATSCSSFEKRLNDKKTELKMDRDKIAAVYREGFQEFDNFINNSNNSPFSNLNSFYLNIYNKAKEVSVTYDKFKEEVKKLKDNDLIKKLIKEEFNDFKPIDLNDKKSLNIDVWMSKMFVINNDLAAVVESRRRDWNDISNIYRSIYNSELNPNDNLFLSDQTQLIKESTQRHINQAITRQGVKKANGEIKPQYQILWFDKDFVINYNNINVLVNNPDTQINEKIKNFWHTHALGNILTEWVNVVVDSTAAQQDLKNDYGKSKISINATKQLGLFLNKIKKEYDDFSSIKSNEFKTSYANLVTAYNNLTNEISKVNSANANKFPVEKFLNYFNDLNSNNTYNSGPFGKMNKALEDLYALTKTL